MAENPELFRVYTQFFFLKLQSALVLPAHGRQCYLALLELMEGRVMHALGETTSSRETWRSLIHLILISFFFRNKGKKRMSIKDILSVPLLLKLHSQMFLPSSHFLPIRWERWVSERLGGCLAVVRGQPTTDTPDTERPSSSGGFSPFLWVMEVVCERLLTKGMLWITEGVQKEQRAPAICTITWNKPCART